MSESENIIPSNPEVTVGADYHPPVSPIVPVAQLASDLPPHKKLPLFVVLLIALLAAISVFAIYLLIQVRSLTLSKLPPLPSPTPLVSADPTADWQTYTSEQFKFSFKYPSAYQMQGDPGNTKYISLITNQEESYKDQIGVDIQSIVDNISYDKVIASEESKLEDVSEEILDNWKKITGHGTGYSEGETFTLFIYKYNNNAIKVTTISQNNELLSNLDQILSTFKFSN